jgi:alkanesulfonate monooxygenase SsuD/methylene tetrahydromethanopterin reductase-like flavin-dependent oxidoreductase (luciferase family)
MGKEPNGRNPAELEARLSWIRRVVPMFAALPLDALTGMLQESFNAFVRTPEQLIEQIRKYAAAGADEVMLQFAGLDDIEGLEVLAEHILPKVRNL